MNDASTIYALSTGSGRAGIAVIRVSGPRASHVIEAMTGGSVAPRQAALRSIRSGADIIDRGLVLLFPGPGSATGEDVAEFHVHGSPAIIAKLFSAFSQIEGLVPAEPGAFTRRAFENGVMDLVEVEGLADLLSATSESQRRLAMRQFLGEASSVYEDWRMQLLTALAYVDAAIDFVDEPEVVAEAFALMKPVALKLKRELDSALQQSEMAGAVRDGLRVVIAGAPNVGKSSLLNWLAGRQAAIVSELAGTTRDVVEAAVEFEGVRLVLADTAGLRLETSDVIERAGMDRAATEIRDADLLVWVTAPDVCSEVGPDRKPDLVVMNKADMEALDSIQLRNESDLQISLKYGSGLVELRAALVRLVHERSDVAEQAVVVRDRHAHAVAQTIRILNDIVSRESKPIELVAEELRRACRVMSSIAGRVDVEDLLGRIFSEFCIGK